MRSGKQMEWVTYEKVKNEVSCLLELLCGYRQFGKIMCEELLKNYLCFRVEFLIDYIHNEIGKIKQSIRYLHQYQKFLFKLSSLYQ